MYGFLANKLGFTEKNKQEGRSAKNSTVLILILKQTGHRRFILVLHAEDNLWGNPR